MTETTAQPCLNGTSSSLYAVTPDGHERWRFDDGIGDMSTPLKVAPNGTLYVAGSERDQICGSQSVQWREKVWAFGPAGFLYWSRTIDNRTYYEPKIAVEPDGTILTMSADQVLALGSNGTALWSYNTSLWQSMTAPVVAPNGTLFVGTAGRVLYVFGPGGSALWNYTSPWGSITSLALDAVGDIYLVSDGLLLSLRWGGSVVWSFNGGTSGYNFVPSQPIVAANGLIFLVGSGGAGSNKSTGQVYALDRNGTLRWMFSVAYAVPIQGFGSIPAISADGVLYVAGLGLYAFGGSQSGTPGLPLLLAVAVAAPILVIALIVVLVWLRRRRRAKTVSSLEEKH